MNIPDENGNKDINVISNMEGLEYIKYSMSMLEIVHNYLTAENRFLVLGSTEHLGKAFEEFKVSKGVEIEREVHADYPDLLFDNIFKIRGVFSNEKVANKKAAELAAQDKFFNIYTSPVGKWCPIRTIPCEGDNVVSTDELMNKFIIGQKVNKANSKQLKNFQIEERRKMQSLLVSEQKKIRKNMLDVLEEACTKSTEMKDTRSADEVSEGVGMCHVQETTDEDKIFKIIEYDNEGNEIIKNK